MRLQSVIFIPPAALITACLFFLTSSIVSALEAGLTARAGSNRTPSHEPIEIVVAGDDCAFLSRRFIQVSRDLRSCGTGDLCAHPELACSVELTEQLVHEREELIATLANECEGRPLFDEKSSLSAGWQDASTCDEGDADCGVVFCAVPDLELDDSDEADSFVETFMF